MARHLLPREPESAGDHFERIEASRASELEQLPTTSATQATASTIQATASATQTTALSSIPSPSSSGDGRTETSTAPTATSSPLTSIVTGTAAIPTSALSNAADIKLPGQDAGLSQGALVAAVVVPTVAVLLLLVFGYIALRKRAQKRRGRTGSGGASFLPSLRDKGGSLRSSASMHQNDVETARGASVVNSKENNAYFTGLDTSSYETSSEREGHSAEFYDRTSEGDTTLDIPAPVYNIRSQSPVYDGRPQSRAPVLPPIITHNESSPFKELSPAPPEQSPTSHNSTPFSPSSAALLAVHPDPPQSSARSAVSISSSLYSETASIHSARAARMSIGGPNIILPGFHKARSGSLGGRDPFGSVHEVSPQSSRNVSPIEERRQQERRL